MARKLKRKPKPSGKWARKPRKPISAIFDALLDKVAPAELARLPADLAEQHDHYVYGTEKRRR